MDKNKQGQLVIEATGSWAEGTSPSSKVKDHYSIPFSPSNPDQTFLDAFQAIADIAQQSGVSDVQRLLQQVEQRVSA